MTRCMGLFQVVTIATWMLTTPTFAQPIRIFEHDIPHAAPFLADVDGDGKKDLLVGQYQDDPHTGARLRLFRNIGSPKVLKFDDGTFIPAGPGDASCDEFCYTGFGPQLVDFNSDGRRDLITGSSDAQLFVFLDLLLGDDWLLSHRTTNPSDEDKKQRAAAFATYRKMNDELQTLHRVPENEASEARAVREAMIAAGNSFPAARLTIDGGPSACQ